MRRALPHLLLAGAVALVSSVALANPVRVGRYAEIPYGIRLDHPRPTEGGGPRRTGRVLGRAPAERPERVWERSLRHSRPRGPTIAVDGTLYFGSDGGVSALAPDGTERWTNRSVGVVHSAPSLTPSGDVVVVTRRGRVVRLSPEGLVRRSAELGAPARGSPLVLDDGSVIVGTIDRQAHRVHRLDASLRRVFVSELPDGTANTVTRTARGALAVVSGRLLALLSPGGSLQRQVSLGGRASSPAAVADDGTIWIPTVEGTLLAVEPGGRVRSRTELGGRHYDGATVAIGRDGAVRVPTLSAGLVCVGPGGTQRWAVTGHAFHAPASIDEADTTLVVDRGGRMLAIDADGTERWRLVLNSASFQPPVFGADGTLYLSTESGSIQAWRAR